MTTGTPGTDSGILVTVRESPFAVKALLAGVLVNKLGAFLQVFLVLFMTSREFSDVQGGTALGVYGAGSVLGVLLGGTFADRIGPRLTIVHGMTGTAVLLLGVLYVHVYWALLVAVFAVGVISQLYRPAAAVLLAELTPEHRQVMVFALYRLALNLGTTGAPVVGALLLTVSYDVLFWGEALASLAYAGIALLALPRGVSATATPVEGRSGGYAAVLADRRFAAYLVAMLINSAVYVQYLGTLPLAMRDAGLEVFWYGVVVAVNGAVVICFELLMTKVVQRWPMRVVLGVGFTLLGGGLALYALPGGLAVFVIGTLMWSLAEIIEGPTMFAYPAQAGPEHLRGRYLGSAHAMFGVGAALGPVVGVALWVRLGPTSWLVFGAASVLALIPAFYGVRPARAAPSGGN
ncbi:MFS transporter [Actinosynnema sp. NPDC020468]|uniref:MFS transporter n=1 Tax=Actinosynnema sp. NPDC020468 TaxID=3154488 RepID=UPI0033F59426